MLDSPISQKWDRTNMWSLVAYSQEWRLEKEESRFVHREDVLDTVMAELGEMLDWIWER